MNDTRQLLLGGARSCIAERGLAETTSRDIAAAAGANLAAITYHFGSKDELVSRALLEGLREWLGPALAVLARGGDPSARALATIQALTTTFAEHRDAAPAYLQALVEAPRRETLHAGVLALWGDLREQLATHIAELRDDGELGAWVDPETMAAMLVSLASGLVLSVSLDPEGPDLEAMAAQFGVLLLAGREPPEPR